jgi:hypothetical protein
MDLYFTQHSLVVRPLLTKDAYLVIWQTNAQLHQELIASLVNISL